MVQTGRKRFGTVSFVTASIQHDAPAESPLSVGAATMQSNTGQSLATDGGAKNAAFVIEKLFT
jgi:hypothetical protein